MFTEKNQKKLQDVPFRVLGITLGGASFVWDGTKVKNFLWPAQPQKLNPRKACYNEQFKGHNLPYMQ